MIEFLQIVRNALALDVADLSYLYRPQNIDTTLLSRVGQPKPGIFVRIGSFLWHMLKLFWQLPESGQMPSYPTNAALFFVSTNNQTVAIRALAKELDNSCLLGIHGFGNQQIPILWAYIWSFFFFPVVVVNFLRTRGNARRSFRYVFDAYWLSYGYYILVRRLLRKMQPVIIVMANDHVMWTRTLLRAAQDEKIQTVYLQHASVTERFPPLAFDFALLEGLDAAQKYAACGSAMTKVFLVGLPRFDAYAGSINRNHRAGWAGVCVNPQNRLAEVATLAESVRQNVPMLRFVLRPHPGDTRRQMWQDLAQQHGWKFSDGREESAFQFLSQVDVVLAGDSNILLEAALMNVYPIYYDFLGEKLDWYGFYKNGLTPYYADPHEASLALKKLAATKPDVRFQTKRYCASVNTAYDGRSLELTLNLIKKIISGARVVGEDWQRVPQVERIEVYEMVEADVH